MNCAFCGKNGFVNKKRFPNQFIEESNHCIVILDRTQLSRGHTLVILNKHRINITDQKLTEEERKDFIDTIYYYAKFLKNNIKDNAGNKPKRIYVGYLGDGEKHLHAHLIPRYPFNKSDNNFYKCFFQSSEKTQGGFWYVALRERNYQKSEFFQKTKKEKNTEYKKIIKLLKNG
jgi:diadenosine tetraphosphate (Ap4A) HIT family hydrolase